jgi:hypothetical protein
MPIGSRATRRGIAELSRRIAVGEKTLDAKRAQ